tara:strand:- start:43 stop:714 length:672 start_codon:yes stop_codon:yes gene_type:complete
MLHEVLPKAVIFDWDSTLVDNWQSIANALNATLIKMGKKPWTVTQVRQNSKNSARDAFPRLFGDQWKDALAFFYQSFEELHLTGIKPLPGAENLLRFLREERIYSGIISNKNGTFLRKEIKKLDWNRYFDNVLGATDLHVDKPSKEVIYALLKHTEISPSESVWFVGDATVDLECAHMANCKPILVETGLITKKELRQWPPSKTFPSCLELRCFLAKIKKNSK